MQPDKVKKILGITIVSITLILIIEGVLLFRLNQNKSKSPAFKATEFNGVITSFGGRDEFTIEKNGQVVYQNKQSGTPAVLYHISSPGKMYPATWNDLKLGDKVAMMLTYTPDGKTLQYRTLRIFRN